MDLIAFWIIGGIGFGVVLSDVLLHRRHSHILRLLGRADRD